MGIESARSPVKVLVCELILKPETTSMNTLPEIYVGIDFHQEASSVAAMGQDGNVLLESNCESSAEYIDKFIRWGLGQIGPYQIVATVEACGGSSKLAEDLRKLGWKIDLAHAATVAKLGKNLDKTDRQDAHVLADLVRVGYVPQVFLAPERQRQLRSLVRYRQKLSLHRTQIKQRIRGLMREAHLKIRGVSAWTIDWIKQLRAKMNELGEERAWVCQELLEELALVLKRIKVANERIKPAVAKAPGSARLLKQKGVGLITAATLLAEIGDFSRFRTGKRLSRYCGIAPVNRSSGNRDAQSGIGKACNSGLRRILIEASHRLSRYAPRWKEMKAHLISVGKKRAVAAVAVANRWIRWLHHEMTRPLTAEEIAA